MSPEQLTAHPSYQALPLIAILRGITPEEAKEVALTLVEEGFGFIEVPLNSVNALESIRTIIDTLGDSAMVGAGTVTSLELLEPVLDVGGQLVVTPNMSPEVIKRARKAGCVILPGVATPTEAFAAIAAGASGLKFFPAELVRPPIVKAIKAVLPQHIPCFPVGGITANPELMKSYLAAGAKGFGLGSSLYQPGISIDDLRRRAIDYKRAWEEALNEPSHRS